MFFTTSGAASHALSAEQAAPTGGEMAAERADREKNQSVIRKPPSCRRRKCLRLREQTKALPLHLPEKIRKRCVRRKDPMLRQNRLQPREIWKLSQIDSNFKFKQVLILGFEAELWRFSQSAWLNKIELMKKMKNVIFTGGCLKLTA